MKKILLLLVLVAVIVLLGYNAKLTNKPTYEDSNGMGLESLPYKNISYEIEGQTIPLVSGQAQTEIAPGSSSKTITKYFGNEATGDLNSDGKEDIAFLVTQEGGGSGTFYYAVVALGGENNSLKGTNGVFLGDRIAPQVTEIRGNLLVVNFAERKNTDPMATPPSIGVSKYFYIENGKLVEKETPPSLLEDEPKPMPPVTQSPKEICISNKGTWLPEFNECEHIQPEICKSMGGIFDECASVCRHQQGERVCTLQCVGVCTVK